MRHENYSNKRNFHRKKCFLKGSPQRHIYDSDPTSLVAQPVYHSVKKILPTADGHFDPYIYIILYILYVYMQTP